MENPLIIAIGIFPFVYFLQHDKAEASAQSTLRAATSSTITVAEMRVIVSVCVCERLRASQMRNVPVVRQCISI